jgi:hypothetical protein
VAKEAESIRCPKCGRVSYNAGDIRERYCGNCHEFHDQMAQPGGERLRRVLRVGDTLALFPVLKDWPTEELQALVLDAEVFMTQAHADIDKAWAELALTPAAFFDQRASRELDRVREEKKFEFMCIMSEICSVAIFYLNERGAKVGFPGEEMSHGR